MSTSNAWPRLALVLLATITIVLLAISIRDLIAFSDAARTSAGRIDITESPDLRKSRDDHVRHPEPETP